MLELSQDAIAMLNAQGAAWAGRQVKEDAWVKDEATMVFSNPQQGDIWSIVDGDGYKLAPSDTLQGQIVRLWHKKYDDGRINWYLKVSHGTESFIIQSAHGRAFSSSMLSAIAMMTVEQVQQPVRIKCGSSSNDKGRMHFCNIEAAGVGRIQSARLGENELAAAARNAQAVVAQANGYTYEFPGQVTEPSRPEPLSVAATGFVGDDDIPL